MATSPRLITYVDELTKCSICLDDLVDPKSLPCLHTFCQKCIKGHCRNTSPGDQAHCPICRSSFVIPQPGVEQLKSNFFIEGLVEAKRASYGTGVSYECEVCADDCDSMSVQESLIRNWSASGDTLTAAKAYCSSCGQKLCGSCSKIHQKIPGGDHRIIPLGSSTKEDLLKLRGSFCKVHPSNKLEIYCIACRVNICVTCHALKHREHNISDIVDIYKTFCPTLTNDVEQVTSKELFFLQEVNRLVLERKEYVDRVESIEEAMLRNADELKRQIDEAVNQLVLKLSDEKRTATKPTDTMINDLEFAAAASHSFTRYSRQLLDNGKPSDVTHAYNDLHARAAELVKRNFETNACRLPKVIKVTANEVYDRAAEVIKNKQTAAGAPIRIIKGVFKFFNAFNDFIKIAFFIIVIIVGVFIIINADTKTTRGRMPRRAYP